MGKGELDTSPSTVLHVNENSPRVRVEGRLCSRLFILSLKRDKYPRGLLPHLPLRYCSDGRVRRCSLLQPRFQAPKSSVFADRRLYFHWFISTKSFTKYVVGVEPISTKIPETGSSTSLSIVTSVYTNPVTNLSPRTSFERAFVTILK
jgi:hypothetical protein